MVLREEDYTFEVVRYLKENVKRGYKLEDLKFLLMKQGYSRSIVERASQIVIEELEKERKAATPVVISKPEPVIEEKKESILKKILNFFKNIFKKKEKV